jgi:hypothetical protein
MWLHQARLEPPTLEETKIAIDGHEKRVITDHKKNYTGDREKRYYTPGHFLNKDHINKKPGQKFRVLQFGKRTKEQEKQFNEQLDELLKKNGF